MAIVEGRVNITPRAREINASGVSGATLSSPPLLLNSSYPRKSPEVMELWYNMKPEFYELTAIVIDRLIKKVLQKKTNTTAIWSFSDWKFRARCRSSSIVCRANYGLSAFVVFNDSKYRISNSRDNSRF